MKRWIHWRLEIALSLMVTALLFGGLGIKHSYDPVYLIIALGFVILSARHLWWWYKKKDVDLATREPAEKPE